MKYYPWIEKAEEAVLGTFAVAVMGALYLAGFVGVIWAVKFIWTHV